MSISQIIAKYRDGKSLREFAADISLKMPEPISHQTIKNWEDGINLPSYYFMLAMAMHNDDWRRRMALEILAILNPEFKIDQNDLDKEKDNRA